ncbi:unnamed protein product [Urochloa humidicola]
MFARSLCFLRQVVLQVSRALAYASSFTHFSGSLQTHRNSMEMQSMNCHVSRRLLTKHLESIVNFRVWRQTGGVGKQAAKEDPCRAKEGGENKGKAGTQSRISYGTGVVIHCTDSFALVLSCAHTFSPFQASDPKHGGSYVDEDMVLAVDFVDGYSTNGHICELDWSYDMSIVIVFLDHIKRGGYEAVKFTENSYPLGFSKHGRNAVLHCIYCFPADQDRALFGTAVSGNVCGPPRLGLDVDPKLHSELKMVQFEMSGADGCSGAPLFTQDLHVMGLWISHVGDNKFGVCVESICEWLQKTYNIKEATMTSVVSKVALIYSTGLAQIDRLDS